MATPTAALHGVAKAEASNSATATLVSDSAAVTIGQWLMVVVAGFFNDVTVGTTTFTIAKTAGTSTVGASVTPTSPGATSAYAQLDVGSSYSAYGKVMYLPVTASGTLTVTATRSGGSLDHAWNAGFVAVTNPAAVGSVGSIADLTAATTLTVTNDAALSPNSLLIAACYDNNGAHATTHPSGMTELVDQNNAGAGESFDVAKQEGGSPATANQFANLTATAFGRLGIGVEIMGALVPRRTFTIFQSIPRSNLR